ncbi:MAG: hypothetical protein HYY40_13345 [Bacteroidetes bacterium]|nr:hypothetical protein [Bacteroidota bacterium]
MGKYKSILFFSTILFFAFISWFVFSSDFSPVLKIDCYYLTFDDALTEQCIIVDTVTDKTNIWQIGRPKKNTLNSPLSAPNVIITDTINAYPAGDTSCFYIKYVIGSWGIFSGFGGYYWVNTDTISDFSRIEISADSGTTWIDLLNDTLIPQYVTWYAEKPVLTGNSYGWKYFEVGLYGLLYYSNLYEGDTVYFRFTFFSDSIQNNKDGIMFDNFYITSIVEGIDEKEYSYLPSKAIPSVSGEFINITIDSKESNETAFELYVFEQRGRKIYESDNIVHTTLINIQNFSPGIYYYELVNYNEKKFASGKFIVN